MITMVSDAKSPFEVLPARIDLPGIDKRISAWWGAERVFARSLERTAQGPSWVFYEGPPTANGSPGTHHVEARVFKDVFPRFKTMKGYSVPRQAGWDCHGLPVELAVEKEMGLSGKPDIEKVGVAEFNARCRESVMRHVGEFEELTQRMGYWIDLAHPYTTMSPEYIDSVWWSLNQIYSAGLLTQDFRVAPYCPRDQTTLSDHEVAQGYETVSDPSVYVRLPLLEPLVGISEVDLLIWTTTPWTLVANTAVAVNPGVEYSIARTDTGVFVVASPLLARVLGDHAEVLATVAGTKLIGARYARPFDLVEIPDAHLVLGADYVTIEDGTGLVHQAPAFGADDLATCQKAGLPVVNPVTTNGHFADGIGLVGGLFFKDADQVLIDDLTSRHLLFRSELLEHSYPHCWRCHTPLMYYAQLSWYIRTTAVREQLRRENEATNWYPEHIKHGRYGDWLDNNVDWALSRSRYWGTPLPLWGCDNGHLTAVGSRAELGALTGSDLSELDPHRPYIDQIHFPCPDCGQITTRVSEVIDAWYDSGAMPFAALGYPHLPGSVETFAGTYPAQYICEAIDQTRGWFYTLMAIGTLVFDNSSYENVVCLGHILAEDGRKMSKHLGNILAPIPLMDTYGADALRWFMACSGSPWAARRIGPTVLEEITRTLLLTYWNTASFFTLYASHSLWNPVEASETFQRPVLDRWILARLHSVIVDVDESLERYDTTGAGRALLEFVDDLSNWYVRRSRSRFWAGDPDALVTLYDCLDALTRLLAPFVPFVTEEVWQHVIRPGNPDAPDSVHLADWPAQPQPTLLDDNLLAQMDVARAVTEAGRSARKASGVRIRQPLARALVGLPAGVTLSAELLADIGEELNVKQLSPLSAADTVLDVQLKPNFRALGRRFGKQTQAAADAIRAADPGELLERLRTTGSASIDLHGTAHEVTTEDVTVIETPRTGWVVESQRGSTIALDTELTEDLVVEGTVRDLVRVVQQARRDAGLDISDRIALTIAGPSDVLVAATKHDQYLAAETLANTVAYTDHLDSGSTGAAGNAEVTVQVRKA